MRTDYRLPTKRIGRALDCFEIKLEKLIEVLDKAVQKELVAYCRRRKIQCIMGMGVISFWDKKDRGIEKERISQKIGNMLTSYENLTGRCYAGENIDFTKQPY